MKKTLLLWILLVVTAPGAAWALTDYSDQFDGKTIRAAYRAGLISREDYLVSRLSESFRLRDERAGSKASSSGFSPRTGREITLLLKQAAAHYDTFSDEGRAFVDRLLMRPTSPDETWLSKTNEPPFYLPPDVLSFNPPADSPIHGIFTFWYVTHDTPDSNGVRHTATTDFLAQVVSAFETAYVTEVEDLGYPAPLPDTNAEDHDNEGSGTIDIYLMNCGAFNTYGYTVTVDVYEGNSCSSFMVVDNDFSFAEFGTEPVPTMQVTVAHELHHAIQFGINVNMTDESEGWIMEATSTWMETQVFPDIKDNIQYLNGSYGFFANPGVSLDDVDQWYNNWIFLEYLNRNWGTDSVWRIWDYLEDVDIAHVAVAVELSNHGKTWALALTDFALKNYNQTALYLDADLYDEVRIDNAPGQILDYSTQDSHLINTGTLEVNHLAASYHAFRPGPSIGPDDSDTLLIQVTRQPGRTLKAAVAVRRPDDSVSEYELTEDSWGRYALSLSPFNQADVTEAVVVLVNPSTSGTMDPSWMTIKGGLGQTLPPVNDTLVATESKSSGCFIGALF
ncbi:hypothetical protein JCM14469_10580 [Desulfatiferula olefinivorans]